RQVGAGGRVDDPSGGVFENADDDPPRWLPSWLRPPGQPVPIKTPTPEPEPELTPVR
ncbi:MAG: hypothetical protein QOE20_345, partial [Mycobacterium sp.]|nr:hypothetical protein [Mycobacterium sp.]